MEVAAAKFGAFAQADQTREELAWITSVGADIAAVFHAPTTTCAERSSPASR